MNDFLGNPIVPGSLIFYGRRDGNSSLSALALVVEVKREKLSIVRLAETSWRGVEWFKEHRKTPKGDPESVLVIPESLLPEECIPALRDAQVQYLTAKAL